ncbi:MAG: molybdopterin molybdotransferase MoeA [Cytophagaceae bacterium]|jgi:molybdopterin molybdotransferase|nr:molybdopterin molybdotransferase MoeA [Cytophagaceae bacterium]
MADPISLQEAQAMVLANTSLMPVELVPLAQALGRILSVPILADRHYPPFHRAAMDGYALQSSSFDPNTRYICAGEIFAGQPAEVPIRKGLCVRIMTGAAVPAGYDAVVRVEDTEVFPDQAVHVKLPELKPWQHIAREGEDLTKGSEALSPGTRIQAGEIAVLASLGVYEVPVFSKPKVALITTGNEIVPIDQKPLPFQIRNSNASTLLAQFASMGITVSHHVHVLDDPQQMKEAVLDALSRVDAIVLSGGVSAGKADFVPAVLQDSGVKKLFHKVQIKPGKPVWVGQAENGVRAFALPGNPLSVQVCCKLFVEPWIWAAQGHQPGITHHRIFTGSRKKKTPLDEMVMVKEINQARVQPTHINGSGDITATAGVSGFIIQEASCLELHDGMWVPYFSW